MTSIGGAMGVGREDDETAEEREERQIAEEREEDEEEEREEDEIAEEREEEVEHEDDEIAEGNANNHTNNELGADETSKRGFVLNMFDRTGVLSYGPTRVAYLL